MKLKLEINQKLYSYFILSDELISNERANEFIESEVANYSYLLDIGFNNTLASKFGVKYCYVFEEDKLGYIARNFDYDTFKFDESYSKLKDFRKDDNVGSSMEEDKITYYKVLDNMGEPQTIYNDGEFFILL